LIYQHRCVEQIYIHIPDDNQRSAPWITRIPKIRDCWLDYSLLLRAVYDDIELIFSQSSLWSNVELLEKCHTQTFIHSSKEPVVALNVVKLKKDPNLNKQIHIVVLHCGNNTLFHTGSQNFQLSEFSDVLECVQNLGRTDVKSVFFIVSGEVRSIIQDLKTITMLKQFHTIYFFVPVMVVQELDEILLSYKNIGRVFDNLGFLLTCLTADIKFYLEQLLYIPILSVFSSQNNTKIKNKLDLTEGQAKFAAFQLFIKNFREAPTSICCNQNLYDRCLTLIENKLDGKRALQILKTKKEHILDWFVNVPVLSVIMNSLLQEPLPKNLLDIRQVIMAIDQRFAQITSTSSSTVYRVQFLCEEDLKIMETNTHSLISFHTYIVATKDLLTARSIARQAAKRGLLVTMLQIEIPSQMHVLALDNNRLIFRFGTIFRIKSINLAPDGVWYTELKCADIDFQLIQERLELQMGEELTWLTLGNYLCALGHSDDAKYYLRYLKNALPKDHEILPSIFNNMGLIYAELGDHEKSLKYYDRAMRLFDKISRNTDHNTEEVQTQQSQREEAL
jgi:tetratricopeptide (TPR) repeat protein